MQKEKYGRTRQTNRERKKETEATVAENSDTPPP